MNQALEAWIDRMPNKIKYPGHDGEGLEHE